MLTFLVREKKLHSCRLIWLFLIQLNEYPYSRYYLRNIVPVCWQQKKNVTPSLLSNNFQSSRRDKVYTQETTRDQFSSSILLIISSSSFYLLITYSYQILYVLFYTHYLCEFLHANPAMRCYSSSLMHEDIVDERSSMTFSRSYIEWQAVYTAIKK